MKFTALIIATLVLTQISIQPATSQPIQQPATQIAQSTQTAADYIAQGDAKYNSGDKQGAIQDYDRAIELDPENAEAYTDRGVAKSDLGDKQGAIEDVNKAAELFKQQGETESYQKVMEFLNLLQDT
jgi:Flp pilus assembly protein TadD